MTRFVFRMTRNPAADLARGWSAWGGEYETSPLSLSTVDNEMCARDLDEYDVINAIDDQFVTETDDGWEIVDSEAAREAVAEWCRNELDIDVQLDVTTNKYTVRHHDGLSCYATEAETAAEAIAEAVARHDSVSFTTGGERAIDPVAFFSTPIEDVYIFECREVGWQHDS